MEKGLIAHHQIVTMNRLILDLEAFSAIVSNDSTEVLLIVETQHQTVASQPKAPFE